MKDYYFASCPKGVEELVEKELLTLKIKTPKIKQGGVQFQADFKDVVQFMLFTRLTSRVYREVTFFTINKEKDLYKKVKEYEWQKLINIDQTFKITTLLNPLANQEIKNSHHLSLVFKDAIVDKIRESSGNRPDVNVDNPDYSFLLRLEKTPRKNNFWGSILLDLTGLPLSNRQYRPSGHVAPLRENLAAAIIELSGFDGSQTLHDLMCGTGTFLCEALIKKYNLPPTYWRLRENPIPFGFMKHKWFLRDEELLAWARDKFKMTLDDAAQTLDKVVSEDIFVSDLHTNSRKLTLQSLKKFYKLGTGVNFKIQDATSAKPELPPVDGTKGIVIINPPYGERMGEVEDLKDLYHQLGENFKQNWKGHNIFILTSEPELRKAISLQTSKRIPLYNGSLECRLLRYDIY